MSTDQPTETLLLTAKEVRGETRFLSSFSVAILATHMGAINGFCCGIADGNPGF